MEGLPLEKRKELGKLLDTKSQDEVMSMIPQFSRAEYTNIITDQDEPGPGELGILVFNIERGVHLKEINEYLLTCPDIRPCDVVLANELDDGCFRSGNLNVAREIALSAGFNYAWGLEFIELVNDDNKKGFHGNAIFSKYPIKRAGTIRLPEQYNWYFDRQKRIGGRLAVYAELDVHGKPFGVVSIHLENRTDGSGRMAQMKAVLESVKKELSGMPVILGGDLNTNTFDGRDKKIIGEIAESPELKRRCLEEVFRYEPLLPLCVSEGYKAVPETPAPTRRKPLPDGKELPLNLDWILLKGVKPLASRMVSTAAKDLEFAAPGSALRAFKGKELSDHNAVWALCREE